MKIESIIKEAKANKIEKYKESINKQISKANVNICLSGLFVTIFVTFLKFNLITQILSIFIFPLFVYFLFNFLRNIKKIENYEKMISLLRRGDL